MKKKFIGLIFMAVMITLMCACSNGNKTPNDNQETAADTETDKIKIISNGQEYTPLENWIFTDKDGLAADGEKKQPQDVADELTVIPIGDDFEIVITGQTTGKQYYTLFDDKFQEVYYRQDTFELPTEQGEYILCFEVSWGNEMEISGFQYFCKLSI